VVSTKGARSSHINRRLNISSVTSFSYASSTSIPFLASTAKASLSAAPGTAEESGVYDSGRRGSFIAQQEWFMLLFSVTEKPF